MFSFIAFLDFTGTKIKLVVIFLTVLRQTNVMVHEKALEYERRLN